LDFLLVLGWWLTFGYHSTTSSFVVLLLLLSFLLLEDSSMGLKILDDLPLLSPALYFTLLSDDLMGIPPHLMSLSLAVTMP
jgi:hypothetical protein